MSLMHSSIKDINSVTSEYNLSSISIYQQSANIFRALLSEMINQNPEQANFIAGVANGFTESHNKFQQTLSHIDLPRIEAHMDTLISAIRAGQAELLFPMDNDIFSFKDDLLSTAEQLRNSTIELRHDMEAELAAKSKIQVPGEISAPIRVEITDNRITLLNRQTHIGNIDYPAANRVRESLRETFSELLDNLPTSSNVDGRFVKACSRLLSYLTEPLENVSIEAFGLNYQLVSRLTSRLAEETGATIIDEIQHTLTGIGVLLNQFQEWQDYLGALALTQIDRLDSAVLVEQAIILAEQIETQNVPVDISVAKRIREMVEPVINGLINCDTIAAPLVGSLSNYFALLSTFVLQNSPAIPTGVAAAVVGGSSMLLGYAVDTLRKFSPVLCQYHPLKFILDVVSWFTGRYSQTKDVLLSVKNGS